jgi:hypothetical protein
MRCLLTHLLAFSVFSAIGCAPNGEPSSKAPNGTENAVGSPPSDPVPQVSPDGSTEPNENDDHAATPTTFSVGDLLATASKATTRFERLAIAGSSFVSVKTWKSDTYAWAKLTYNVTAIDNSAPTTSHLYLACHFHGDSLGCHKKEASDPSEPAEAPDLGELPPMDDELPFPEL